MSINCKHIEKPVIILAGGFGTRLQSVLNGIPKPLADINGTPFLDLLFSNLIEHGFSTFILSLHYKSEKIITHIEGLKKSILKNCKIDYVIEENPLGTGGAISYVVKKMQLENHFFVVNADTWIESGYELLNSVNENVIGTVSLKNTSRYGKVFIDDNNNIIKFEEKLIVDSPGLINAGVYKLSASLFSDWDGFPYSLEKDLFPNLIENQKLKGLELKTKFIDIGIPEDYLKFCSLMKI